MTTEIKLSKKREIKAPQAIVHIKHNITLRQYKVWIVLLQKYRECYEKNIPLDEDGYYRFSKLELDRILGYEIKKEVLKEELEKIRREGIIISFLEKGGEKVTEGMGFISKWKVSSKTIAVEIPSFLRRVMEGLDNEKAMFQLLNWNIFNHFSGKHEAIIYKLCRDYIGAKNTPYMDIEKFRDYLGLKQDEYPNFKTLNHYVIKKSIGNINKSEISDIFVEVNYRKDEINKRKIVGLYFTVKPKRRQMSLLPFEFGEEKKIAHIEEMLALGLSLSKAQKMEKQYGVECLVRNTKHTIEMKNKGQINKSVSGYLIKAIEDDIAQGVEESNRAKKQKIQERENRETEKEKAKNEQEEKNKKLRELLKKEFLGLLEKERIKIRDEFLKTTDSFTMRMYSKAKEKGLENPEIEDSVVRILFLDFYSGYKQKESTI